jgi:hypothetical protein
MQLSVYKFIFNKNFFISLLFHLFFPYFNLFVSIFMQSYVNIRLHVSTLYHCRQRVPVENVLSSSGKSQLGMSHKAFCCENYCWKVRRILGVFRKFLIGWNPISLLFHLFFLILTCSCQYSCNLMLTSNCMCRPYITVVKELRSELFCHLPVQVN